LSSTFPISLQLKDQEVIKFLHSNQPSKGLSLNLTLTSKDEFLYTEEDEKRYQSTFTNYLKRIKQNPENFAPLTSTVETILPLLHASKDPVSLLLKPQKLHEGLKVSEYNLTFLASRSLAYYSGYAPYNKAPLPELTEQPYEPLTHYVPCAKEELYWRQELSFHRKIELYEEVFITDLIFRDMKLYTLMKNMVTITDAKSGNELTRKIVEIKNDTLQRALLSEDGNTLYATTDTLVIAFDAINLDVLWSSQFADTGAIYFVENESLLVNQANHLYSVDRKNGKVLKQVSLKDTSRSSRLMQLGDGETLCVAQPHYLTLLDAKTLEVKNTISLSLFKHGLIDSFIVQPNGFYVGGQGVIGRFYNDGTLAHTYKSDLSGDLTIELNYSNYDDVLYAGIAGGVVALDAGSLEEKWRVALPDFHVHNTLILKSYNEFLYALSQDQLFIFRACSPDIYFRTRFPSSYHTVRNPLMVETPYALFITQYNALLALSPHGDLLEGWDGVYTVTKTGLEASLKAVLKHRKINDRVNACGRYAVDGALVVSFNNLIAIEADKVVLELFVSGNAEVFENGESIAVLGISGSVECSVNLSRMTLEGVRCHNASQEVVSDGALPALFEEFTFEKGALHDLSGDLDEKTQATIFSALINEHLLPDSSVLSLRLPLYFPRDLISAPSYYISSHAKNSNHYDLKLLFPKGNKTGYHEFWEYEAHDASHNFTFELSNQALLRLMYKQIHQYLPCSVEYVNNHPSYLLGEQQSRSIEDVMSVMINHISCHWVEESQIVLLLRGYTPCEAFSITAHIDLRQEGLSLSAKMSAQGLFLFSRGIFKDLLNTAMAFKEEVKGLLTTEHQEAPYAPAFLRLKGIQK